MKKFILCLSVLFFAGSLAEPAWAVDLRDVLTDYSSTSWSRKDGLTGPIWAIAQDNDGFLWLGTDDGLVRFDGVRFATWESLGGQALPRLPVRAIHQARDGSQWVGFGADGGLARVTGRAVRLFTPQDGATVGAVAAIVEDRSGSVLVASDEGLFRYSGDRWLGLGADAGLPDAAATSVEFDESEALWVGTTAGVYSRAVGESRFHEVEPSGESVRSLSLSADRNGRLWTSDPIIGFRPLGVPARDASGRQSGRGYRILHDRHDNLWVATIGQGLWRVRPANHAAGAYVERTTVLSGLSSDAVRSVFEDRDGNIWAGTTEGIDRLVPHRITPWTSLGLVGTLDVSSDDHIWVGTEDELIRFSTSSGTWQPDSPRLPLRGSRVIRADAGGGLWVLTADDLYFVKGGKAGRVPFPAGISVSWTEAMASDPAGGVWISVIGGVFLHDTNGRLEVVDRIDALRDGQVTAAIADRMGRLWLTYADARVAVLSGKGAFRSFGPAEGLGPGPFAAILADASGDVWVAGTQSLNRFRGDRFTHVTQVNGLPQGGVISLAQDQEQHLWLGTSEGILRLAAREFDLATAAPNYQMYFRIYDTSDGLAGFPPALDDRNAVRAGDGTLWFVTSRGLSQLDPAALSATRRAAKVTVDDVRADDHVVKDRRLPAGTATLDIAYTAAELTYPLKTRFRYRLEGFDADWVEAGTRRQALYTNLPPRTYAFHVAVSGDEGRWSEAATAFDFSIAPRFYQTLWFYPLAAVVLGGLLAGAWQLRLRQLRLQFSLVLGERVRLSRELHDTLLQSLVGVALEFDAVSKSIEASPATAKQRVVKIREHVEEYIREARRSIWSLRSQALETGDLVDALRESAERAATSQDVPLSFEVSGTPRRLAPQIEHQVLRIGQEAVLNAARHAKASHIGMRLDYGHDTLVLRLEDDGVGFDIARTAEGTTDHYGIITMRERAQQAGGDVTITSAPGRGTVIEARIPTTDVNAQEG